MIEKLNLREVENGAHGAQSTVVEGASLRLQLPVPQISVAQNTEWFLHYTSQIPVFRTCLLKGTRLLYNFLVSFKT